MSTSNLQPPAPAPIPPHPGAPGEEFFSRIRGLGIVRPDEGRWVAGVASGLAHRWGVDPLVVRGGFVALSVLGGAGVALYGLCWLFLPHPDGRIHAQEVLSGRVTAGFVGAVIAVLANLGDQFNRNGPFFWHPFGSIVPLVLIGLGIWYAARHGWFSRGTNDGAGGSTSASPGQTPFSSPGQTPFSSPASGDPTLFEPGAPGAQDSPASGGTMSMPSTAPAWAPSTGGPVATKARDTTAPLHSLTFTTLGFAVLAGVGAGMARFWSTGATTSALLVGAAVALGVVALGLVVAGLAGRRGGGLAPIAVLLAIVTLNGMFWRGPIATFGDHQWKPATVAAIDAKGYNLGAGNVRLDLSDPGLLAAATTTAPVTVPLKVGAGHVVIVVPQGTAVVVKAQVGLGSVDDQIHDRHDSGGGNTMTVTTGTGDPVLVVNADLGVGQLEVTQ